MNNPRPKLDFSTIATLWKPELALQIVDQVQQQKGAIKPSFFNSNVSLSRTEAEKYTAQVVRYMCDMAFGATSGKEIPERKQIWTANAKWMRHQIPYGKGADCESMKRFIALYTKHLLEDNGPQPIEFIGFYDT